MTDSLFVSYDGPALASGRMEARELAPALLAMADMFEAANRVVNGDKSKVSVSVSGFKSNCFRIDFDLLQNVPTLYAQLMNFLSSNSVTAITNLKDLIGIGVTGSGLAGAGLLQLKRMLRGREIEKSEDIGDGLRKLHAGDESIIVHEHVEALYRDKQMAKAVDAAITQPLSLEGVDSFMAGTADGPEITIEKAERMYFAAPVFAEEVIEDVTVRMALNIVNVTFQEGNMWRFSKGDHKFNAHIMDEDFLKRVSANTATFSKDDVLIAMVRVREVLEDMTSKTKYEVVKVLEHRRSTPPPPPSRLPFPEEPYI